MGKRSTYRKTNKNQTVHLLTNMLSLDTLEKQISAVVDTLVAVAVSELRRLLNECSDNVVSAQSCTTAAVKIEEECLVAPPEERQQFNRAVTVTHSNTHALFT